MFGRKLLTVGFGLALLSDASCSRPLCEVNPDDSRCAGLSGDMNPSSLINLSPVRLHYQKGGTLTLNGIPNKPSIILKQSSMQDLSAGLSASGEQSWKLTVSSLTGFTPGISTLQITQNGQITEKTVWLYANVAFTESKEVMFDPTMDGLPNWLGVSNSAIYALLNYTFAGQPARHILKLGYSSSQKNVALSPTQPLDMPLPSYAKAAVSQTALIELTGLNNSRYFLPCILSNTSCTFTNTVNTPNTGTPTGDVDIAADWHDGFFAFLDGTSKLTAYAIKQGMLTSTASQIDSDPSSAIAPIVYISTADFNGDGIGDVVTWRWKSGAAGAVSIFLGQTTGGLKYDFAQTPKLQAALSSLTAGGQEVTSFAAGDVDADGLSDLVITRTKSINAIINQGDNFSATGPTLSLNSGTAFTKIDVMAVGDVGGASLPDSRPLSDIVISSKTSGAIAVFLSSLN